MSEVSISAVLRGFDEAKNGLDQLSKSMDDVAASGDKMNKASAPASKGLTDVAKNAEGASEELTGLARAGGVAAGVLVTGVAAAAAYAGKQLLDGIKIVTNLGEELTNLSQITGLSVQKLGGLQLAASTNNLSLEQLTRGVVQFNRHASEAAKGTGDAADAFDRLGISVKDNQGNLKSSDQLLGEVADRFSEYKDSATKSAVAQELFGQAGARMIPLLNEGAKGLASLREEAQKAGIVLSDETAEAANKLNSNMEVLRAYGQGFWVQVASPIVEGLARITSAMRDARKEGAGLFGTLQAGGSQAVLELFGVGSNEQELAGYKQKRDAALSEIARVQRKIETDKAAGYATAGPEAYVRSLYGDVARYNAEMQRLEATVPVSKGGTLDLGTGGDKPEIAPPSPKDSGSGRVGRTAEQLAQQQASGEYRYLQDLVAAGEVTKDQFVAQLDYMADKYSNFESVRADLAGKAATERNKESEAAYREEMKRIGMMLREDESAVKERSTAEKKALQETADARDRTAKVELKQINDTTYLFREQKMQALEELEQKYVDMGDAGKKALIRVRGEMEALRGETKATGVVVQDVGFDTGKIWGQVHDSLATAIADIGRWALGIGTNVKSIGEVVKNFFTGIANTILDTFGKIAANEVFKWLFGGGSTGPGSTGGVAGSVAGGAASGAGSSLFGSLFGGSSGGGGGSGGGILGNIVNTGSSALNWLSGGATGTLGNLVFGGSGVLADAGASIIGSTAAASAGVFGAGGLSAELAAGSGIAASSAGLGAGIGELVSAIPGWGWAVGGALALGSLIGLFGKDKGPKPQQFGLVTNGSGDFWFGQANYLQGVDDLWGELSAHTVRSGIYDPARLAQFAISSGAAGDSFANNLVGSTPEQTASMWLQRIEPARIAPFPSDFSAWFADWGSRMDARINPSTGAVIDTSSGAGYGMGTDMLVSKPTVFTAGDQGTERVMISPVGAAHRSPSGGLSITVNGPMIGDYYSTQKFMRDLQRWARG